MKWNWGTKLMLAMAAFMVMLITFAVLMMKEEINLVDKEYYPKGQAYQEMIGKKERAAVFADSIVAVEQQQQIVLSFPASVAPEKIRGTLHFYDRMQQAGDRFFDLKAPTNGQFVFPINELHGRYILKIDWEYEGQTYYNEIKLTLNQ